MNDLLKVQEIIRISVFYDIPYTDMEFTEIATKHGFNSLHTFIRSVQRQCHMTPSKLRETGMNSSPDRLIASKPLADPRAF